MTVQLGLDLTDGVHSELRRLAMQVRSVPAMLDEMGGALEASTQQRFLDQESPAGDRWKEHSDATRENRGAGADILREATDLFDSISHARVGSAQEAVGVNRVYGRIQHLGGFAGRDRKVEIPARPFLGISKADEAELQQIARDHLEAG